MATPNAIPENGNVIPLEKARNEREKTIDKTRDDFRDVVEAHAMGPSHNEVPLYVPNVAPEDGFCSD